MTAEGAPPIAPLEAGPPCEHLEQAGYLEHAGEQLYYVVHPPAGPKRGQVLLAGPFHAARPRRYISWVRWARHLARHGFEAVRFDYRGIGESTGRFEDFGLHDWVDDVVAVAGLLRARGPEEPLLLHGLELGALLGSRAFDGGVGDALLLWMPPASGQKLLYEQLKLRLVHDFSLDPKDRRTRDRYIEQIEAGEPVEVEGYYWTKALLASARDFAVAAFGDADPTAPRPRRQTRLDKLGAQVFGGGGLSPVRDPGQPKALHLVNPDLSALFAAEAAWIAGALDGRRS